MNSSSLIRDPQLPTILIQGVLALEWLEGGVTKLQTGTFATTLSKTLEHFAQGNPHSWYVTHMLQTALQHPTFFGHLVQWGEVLTGLGLVVGALVALFSLHAEKRSSASWLSGAALVGGIWMNLQFYLAAGWTSPSTAGLNLLMVGVEVCLLLYWIQWTKQPLKK